MQRLLLPALALFLYNFEYADVIVVHNQTNVPVYGATYTGRKVFTRLSDPKVMSPQSTTEFERPEFTLDLSSRVLLVSTRKDDLKTNLTQDQYLLLTSQDISTLSGDTFYLDLYKDKLEIFNSINWRFWQPVRRNVLSPLLASFAAMKSKTFRALFETEKSKKNKGKFRESTALAPEEKDYLTVRKPRVKRALEKTLRTKINSDDPLIIATCCSGGGIRSALATMGFFSGLEKTQLLDTITYATTLSGSTWALNGWLANGKTATTYKNTLIQQCTKPLFGKAFEATELSRHLFQKFVFGHPLSLVDVYGAALGSLFFTKPYQTVLSDQAELIKKGTYCFPIYTAILTKTPYQMIEFNPFRIGCDYLGGDIAPWAFGQEFIRGSSTQHSPEEPLGFLLGIFGYAIGVNVTEALKYAEKSIQPQFLTSILQKGVTTTDLGRQRLLPAQVLNFTYGLLNVPRGQHETLTVIDAGILFNLPLQPLLEKNDRNVDVIIILDNSQYESAAEIGAELEKAMVYFTEKNIKLPSIAREQLASNLCSVFHDEHDSSVPTIIYMPLATHDTSKALQLVECIKTGECSTFKFEYDVTTARRLTELTETQVILSRNKIVQALRQKASQKNMIASNMVAVRRQKHRFAYRTISQVV